MKQICIINTGGTFNKSYNFLTGILEINKNNDFIKILLNNIFKYHNHINIRGIIFKDSLEFDDNDRNALLNTINETNEKKIIVIHGTDTMNLSAEFLGNNNINKTVIFVGSMIPFSINPVEATANLSLALGFIQHCPQDIYISMQGLILPHQNINKNKQTGIFYATN